MNMKAFTLFILTLILVQTVRPAWAKTYWLTGAGIGAGVMGVGAGISAWQVCDWLGQPDDSGETSQVGSCSAQMVPLGVVAGAGVGFGLGALIGMAFKKKQPAVQAIVDPVTGTYGASVGMEF